MKYTNSSAFRRALEDRLRTQSLKTGAPLVRLRKMVAFDRLLARLIAVQADAWVLKGGLALQLRLGDRARTTKDIDLHARVEQQSIYDTLINASALELGDWFQFEVAQSDTLSPDQVGGAIRFDVQALLDGRPFEKFHVDIGASDPVVEPIEIIAAPPLLEFADIPVTLIPCYPLSQHIAEKVHAYTFLRLSGENSRVKDLIDILLMAELGQMQGQLLRRALQATFSVRNTHALPDRLPDPPEDWDAPYRRLAKEQNMHFDTLPDAGQAVKAFIDPVLQSADSGMWDPLTWSWH